MAHHYSFMMNVAAAPEPETLTDSLTDPKWTTAMKEEMTALYDNETWDLVPLPHDEGNWMSVDIQSKTQI